MIDLISEHWRAGIEILVLWILIYQVYRVFRATRGARILVGLGVMVILLTLASQVLELKVIEWIIKSAAAILAFALLIIFQPELRNGLARFDGLHFEVFDVDNTDVFSDPRFGPYLAPITGTGCGGRARWPAPLATDPAACGVKICVQALLVCPPSGSPGFGMSQALQFGITN